MIIAEVVEFLEKIAPISLQEDYDNCGLIVGDRNAKLKSLTICLDVTEGVIHEAIENGSNLIIAHHPFIFKGLKKINTNTFIERVLVLAIKNDIAIYAAHTNFDNLLQSGVNSKIADKLGLKNCSILSPKKGILKKLYTYVPLEHAENVKNALFEAGAGNVGNYAECSFTSRGTGTFKASDNCNPYVGKIGERHHEEELKIEVIFPGFLETKILSSLMNAHPYEEVAYEVITLDNQFNEIGSGLVGELENPVPADKFLLELKEKMNTNCIRYTALCKPFVQRIAVCGGAGGFLLNNAIAGKADMFVSSDFKYHDFFNAESKIIIADIGHFESEQFTIDLFYEILSQKFSIFAIHKTKLNTNPINYL